MIDKNQAKTKGVKIIDSNETLANDTTAIIEQLKSLLPNVINSDNQLDTRALNDVLSIANTTSNNQGYELTFAGKGIARAKANSPTKLELKTEFAQSKNFDSENINKTNNVVIRGDNIEVLKILYQNYHNKIKVIYIDPPYNTESENFIYNDNFKQSENELIERFGLNEDTSDFLHNVYGTRSHSGWLAFMYPRLKLARDLLIDDGAIFISIDDNEQANLKILMDEIFGDDNFVNTISVNVKNIAGVSGGGEDKKLKKNIEFLNIYVKNYSEFQPFSTIYDYIPISEIIQQYKEEEKSWKYTSVLVYEGDKEYLCSTTDGKGDEIKIFSRKNSQINSVNQVMKDENLSEDEFYVKYANKIFRTTMPQSSIRLRIIKKLQELEIKEKFTSIEYTPKSGRNKGQVYEQFYQGSKFNLLAWLKDVSEERGGILHKKETQGTYWDFVGETKNLTKEGDVPFPNGKKPRKLVQKMLNMCGEGDYTVLDFFAGSGTTGDAVMQLNAEDGGNRKFVLVQSDEKIDKNKNAEVHKFCTDNNLEPVISSITIERLNRAGEKIKEEYIAKNGEMMGAFPSDIGYKVFNTTRKPQVSEEGVKKGGKLFSVNNQRASVWDTLYNMLAATCKPLHTPIETLKKDVLYQADNELYLLANIEHEKLSEYADKKINLDGWADIDLEQFLNLDVPNKENITVIY